MGRYREREGTLTAPPLVTGAPEEGGNNFKRTTGPFYAAKKKRYLSEKTQKKGTIALSALSVGGKQLPSGREIWVSDLRGRVLGHKELEKSEEAAC